MLTDVQTPFLGTPISWDPLADKRACEDIADLFFNVETNNKNNCESIAEFYFNVEITNNKACAGSAEFYFQR